ncbi:MAG TPA: hypothetical protein VIA06_14035 [Candidatus Dormibacteraeota bacterium]|jgi:hypothetical protein|nr:hypothetical protein [Candidatus Dormibacteraeota bacterium]
MAKKQARKAQKAGGKHDRLNQDLQRFQMARDCVPGLIQSIDVFVDRFPRTARRRWVDRIDLTMGMAADILAWSGLGTGREETSDLPERSLAASSLIYDPHRLAWQALAGSGLGLEVNAYIARVAESVDELPPLDLGAERLQEASGSFMGALAAFRERLVGTEATSAEGRELGELLLLASIAQDPEEALTDLHPSLRPAASLTLLLGGAPSSNPEVLVTMDEILAELAVDFSELLSHTLSHLETEEIEEAEAEAGVEAEAEAEAEDDGELEEGPYAEAEEEEEEDEVSLYPELEAIDGLLGMTDDPADGARLATATAAALLAQARIALTIAEELPVWERAAAAAGVLIAGDPEEELDDEDLAVAAPWYERTAAMLAAELPETAADEESDDDHLTRLDGLLAAMQAMGSEDDVEEEPAGALGLLGAASEALRIGVSLAGETGSRNRLAAALAVLDPLALADREAEVRTGAAGILRDLAAEARED